MCHEYDVSVQPVKSPTASQIEAAIIMVEPMESWLLIYRIKLEKLNVFLFSGVNHVRILQYRHELRHCEALIYVR